MTVTNKYYRKSEEHLPQLLILWVATPIMVLFVWMAMPGILTDNPYIYLISFTVIALTLNLYTK